MLPGHTDVQQLKPWLSLPADGHSHGATGKLKGEEDSGNPLNRAVRTTRLCDTTRMNHWA
jgi:hypothetical protein